LKRRLVPLLLLITVLPITSSYAQPAATGASTNASTTAMKTFVIIFRQGPNDLTEAQKQRRNEETSGWARAQNPAGHKLDPHILDPESEYRGPEKSAVSPNGWTVTALLFLEAHDLSEATRVAESHPALRYGASVEIRPWAPPVRNVSQAKSAATP
jgi:hypothetical protein